MIQLPPNSPLTALVYRFLVPNSDELKKRMLSELSNNVASIWRKSYEDSYFEAYDEPIPQETNFTEAIKLIPLEIGVNVDIDPAGVAKLLGITDMRKICLSIDQILFASWFVIDKGERHQFFYHTGTEVRVCTSWDDCIVGASNVFWVKKSDAFYPFLRPTIYTPPDYEDNLGSNTDYSYVLIPEF